MLNTMKIQELVKEFTQDNTRNSAISALESYTRDRIEDYIDKLCSYDLEELLKEANEDFHKMDELDEVFEYMTVTEVLEELSNIDPSDEYFNADNKISGNNEWDIADVYESEVVKQLFEGDICWEDYDFNEIMNDYETLYAAIDEYYNVFNKAKALFEQAMAQDPQAVLSVLWNMNAQ